MIKTLIFISISVFLWIAFITPFIKHRTLNTGNIFGTFIALMLFLYGIFHRQIEERIVILRNITFWRIALLTASAVALLIFVLILYFTFRMICAAKNAPTKKTTVIVLGCKVNSNGPSLSLQRRLDAALCYLSKNPDIPCILSGGQGTDEPISEAMAMYNFLTDKGIQAERLYLEDQSTTTDENISFSKKLIEKEGLFPEVTLITNNFHQYRAQKIAKKYKMEVYGVSGGTPLYLLPTYYIRELGGIFAQFLNVFHIYRK